MAGTATLRRGYSEPPATDARSPSDTFSSLSSNRHGNLDPNIEAVPKEQGQVNVEIALTFEQKLDHNIQEAAEALETLAVQRPGSTAAIRRQNEDLAALQQRLN